MCTPYIKYSKSYHLEIVFTVCGNFIAKMKSYLIVDPFCCDVNTYRAYTSTCKMEKNIFKDIFILFLPIFPHHKERNKIKKYPEQRYKLYFVTCEQQRGWKSRHKNAKGEKILIGFYLFYFLGEPKYL